MGYTAWVAAVSAVRSDRYRPECTEKQAHEEEDDKPSRAGREARDRTLGWLWVTTRTLDITISVVEGSQFPSFAVFLTLKSGQGPFASVPENPQLYNVTDSGQLPKSVQVRDVRTFDNRLLESW